MISLGDKKLRMYIRSSWGRSLQKLKFGRLGSGFSEISGSGVERGFDVRISIGTETEFNSLGSMVRNREFDSK